MAGVVPTQVLSLASPSRSVAMEAPMSHLRLRTWDRCEVVGPNFHALNNQDCMDSPWVTWNLGLRTPCELILRWTYVGPICCQTIKPIDLAHNEASIHTQISLQLCACHSTLHVLCAWKRRLVPHHEDRVSWMWNSLRNLYSMGVESFVSKSDPVNNFTYPNSILWNEIDFEAWEVKRLMRLEAHHDGFRPTNY